MEVAIDKAEEKCMQSKIDCEQEVDKVRTKVEQVSSPFCYNNYSYLDHMLLIFVFTISFHSPAVIKLLL